jgi:hypothetical protein
MRQCRALYLLCAVTIGACGSEFTAGGTGATTSASGGAGNTSSSSGGGDGGAPPTSCTPGEALDCYSGPPGTDGVGSCRAGDGICNATGDGFASCTSEVLPVPDSCDVDADTDCSGVSRDHCASTAVFIDAESAAPRRLAIGADDSIFVAGGVRGPLSTGVDCNDAASSGSMAFVSKLDDSGAHQWTWCRGVNDRNSYVHGVAVDAGGAVFVGGLYNGAFDFGSGVIQPDFVNANGGFLVALDAAGNFVWETAFGADSYDQFLEDVRIHSDGDVVVAGSFEGGFDAFGLTASAGSYSNVFVAKLSSDGTTPRWARWMDGEYSYRPEVAELPDGDVVVAFDLQGELDVAGHSFSDDGLGVVLVRLAAADGVPKWATQIGGNGDQRVYGVAADDSRLLVAGTFDALIDFGSGKVVATGNSDHFVASIDPDSGAVLWGEHFGGVGELQYGGGFTLDASGGAVLAASGVGTADFGGGPLAIGDIRAPILLGIDGSGSHAFSRAFPSSGTGYFWSAGLTSKGEVVTFGLISGAVDLGTGSLGSSGFLVGVFPP